MKKGSILYHGNRSIPNPKNPFEGKGQTGKTGQYSFLTNDKKAAATYALGGTLYKLQLTKDITLIDLNYPVNMDYIEGDELVPICNNILNQCKGIINQCPYSGLYISYNHTIEIALCIPKRVLKVSKYWRCQQRGDC